MKVYVINLKRRLDRKESMLNQFENYGITNYEFVEAIDGQLIDPNIESNRRLMNRYAHDLSANEIACAMSHRLVYQKIIESGERATILEDDAILNDSFVDCIDSDIDDHIDMLYFGHFTSNIRNEHAKPQTYDYEIKSAVTSEKGETTICYYKYKSLTIGNTVFYKVDNQSYDIDFLHGAHAYSPSIEMCKHICKIQTKIIFAADGVFNNLKHFNVNNVEYYAALCPIVTQDVSSVSDLSECRVQVSYSEEYTRRVAINEFGT